MKATNIHITCKSFSEKESVFFVLESFGFKHFGQDMEVINVQLKEDGDYQTWVKAPIGEQLTYNQFMEKYAMTELQKTIEAAKKQGYTNKTLSNALGKYDGYIARIISKPQSEKLQKFLVKEINELLVPAQIDDAMMISKEEYNTLSSIKYEKERIEREYSEFQVERDSYVKQFNHDIEKLEKELDHKNQVLDKRNDKYNLLEGEFNELKFHFDNQTKEKEGLIRTINELEQQNKSVVASNFELSTKLTRSTLAIEEFKNVVSKRDTRISELEKDYWTRAGMHITSENKRKKERYWFAGITVALFVLFVISHLV